MTPIPATPAGRNAPVPNTTRAQDTDTTTVPATVTPTGPDQDIRFDGLSARERARLRLLALRDRVRRDTTLRPVADVVYDLRSRHGVQLSMRQVFELLNGKPAR